MKNAIKILLALLVCGSIIFAQNNSSKTYDMSSEAKIEKQEGNNDYILVTATSERIITTSVIVGEVILLLLVLFYWKRTRDDSKDGATNTYKRNINAIREERVRPNLNAKDSLRRRALKEQIKSIPLNGKTVTSTAKKLSIAKGELFLASRIQQLQNQTR